MLTNTCITAIQRISQANTKPELVQVMKHGIEESVKLIKCRSVLDIMTRLHRNKVGTAEVESLSERMCAKVGGSRARTLVNTVMKWKVSSARKELDKQRYQNTKVWRGIKPVLQKAGPGVLQAYQRVWSREKDELQKQERKRVTKKVRFLCNKHKPKSRVYTVIHGVDVTDKVLPSQEFDSSPQAYGGCTTNSEETSLLSLPPKFTVFEKVDTFEVETQVEKALAKLRWDIQSGASSESDGNVNGEIQEHQSVYNTNTKGFNFVKMRATDLPFNKNVHLPKPVDEQYEIAMQELKNRVVKTTAEFSAGDGASTRNLSGSNLRGDEQAGLKSICSRFKDGSEVVMQTDKSSRFSIDTSLNYKEACKPHYEADKVISVEECDKTERLLSAHAVMWTRILNAGVDVGQHARIKKNMFNKDSPAPPLYGLRKDHKTLPVGEELKGPPVRPVCGAKLSPNSKLSHILCTLLDPVWKSPENSTCCMSTEEMVAEICRANDLKQDGQKPIVGSADVKALYPSLELEFTIDIVCEEFRKSQIYVENVDSKELGLYIALNTTRSRQEEIGIEAFCPERRNHTGRAPTITGSGVAEKPVDRYSPWIMPSVEPTDIQIKEMFVEALRISIGAVMFNHTYVFDSTRRKQVGGGAIGLELTGTIAQVFMMWWDRECLSRLHANGIVPNLYKRYVDDVNVVIDPPLQDNEDVDINEERDARTMKMFKDIGDTIHRSIKLEVDYPTNHEDGKVPILDLKIWVNDEGVVLYEHYMKPISSRFTVHERSAITMSTKRQILTQDALRVLLNCSESLPWLERIKHLQQYENRMQYSGYKPKMRYEVIDSAVKAYRKIQKEASDGVRPMYRLRSWNYVEREKKKREKRANWYRKGGYQSVLFIPATPGSVLKKKCEAEIRNSMFKIRVVEKAGRSLKDMVQKSDPFRGKQCQRTDCPACYGSGKGRCDQSGITYEVCCKGCGEKYIGQTARTMYTRGREHVSSLAGRRGPLWQHCVDKHESAVQEFEFNKRGSYGFDSMMRQISEAVMIENEKPSMNHKEEWNYVHLPRVDVV